MVIIQQIDEIDEMQLHTQLVIVFDIDDVLDIATDDDIIEVIDMYDTIVDDDDDDEQMRLLNLVWTIIVHEQNNETDVLEVDIMAEIDEKVEYGVIVIHLDNIQYLDDDDDDDDFTLEKVEIDDVLVLLDVVAFLLVM